MGWFRKPVCPLGTVGSNPTLSAIPPGTEEAQPEHGEVSEWLKEHAWKACVSVPGTEGSNPSLSATSERARGSGTVQRFPFEPGQAGNGAALRTGAHVFWARAHFRARFKPVGTSLGSRQEPPNPPDP